MKNLFKKEISVVIPVFNEQGSISELIKRISISLKKAKFIYQIIIVDDNSTDHTASIVKKLGRAHYVSYLLKHGKKGKAYSLFEGFAKAIYQNIAFIDADLQYPPEEIVKMALELRKADIVSANRKQYNDSLTRRILSRSFRLGFGKILFGLDHDIQAGLKVFKKEVITTIGFVPSTQWTFDLEFLRSAKEAGFKVINHDITFQRRKKGNSKVGLLKTSYEIGTSALRLKLKPINPFHVNPQSQRSMRGAGLRFKRQKYITHSTLQHSKTSITTFTAFQKSLIVLLLGIIGIGVFVNIVGTLTILIGVLSFIYFADTLFNLYVVLKSLHIPQEITIGRKRIAQLDEKNLPVYTILCPLYKEAHIIPQFVKNIKRISWPKDKLDVMLLLEEDDVESIESVKQMTLPPYIRAIIVPHSQPKTKPKACNYGLSYAKGEYLVIFDAEDKPEKDQLKKAYLAFMTAGKDVVCLQAKLNYYNPNQNLLTRFFTAEYSLWFDITLTGLQSINTSIPLGGTSNHFRTQDIKALHGWDPFNVTEDADLGMRLFKDGYKTAIINSTTFEEANSKWGNWVRQRSRWIKGYMQTYLVHTRGSFKFAREKGRHFPIFHLIIGGKIAFILINPILWIATISYFTLYAYVGPTIERLYPGIIFYMAVFSLVFGNFLFMYYYMIGVMKRKQYSLVKYTFLVPFYWLMISVAGFMALYQLIFKPFYWEKTVHGLHLLKKPVGKKAKIPRVRPAINWPVFPRPAFGFLIAFFKISPLGIVVGIEDKILAFFANTLILIGIMERKGASLVVSGFKKLIVLPLKMAMSLFV